MTTPFSASAGSIVSRARDCRRGPRAAATDYQFGANGNVAKCCVRFWALTLAHRLSRNDVIAIMGVLMGNLSMQGHQLHFLASGMMSHHKLLNVRRCFFVCAEIHMTSVSTGITFSLAAFNGC
jgi:hypothetical protein